MTTTAPGRPDAHGGKVGARAVPLLVDDFSTGPFTFTAPPDTASFNVSKPQSGSMLGGFRLINFLCNEGENKRAQPMHIDISNQMKTPGRLTLSVGTTATAHVGLLYGSFTGNPAAPLHLDASSFTKCVVTFDWLLQSTKINVHMFSGDGRQTTVGADTKGFGTEQNPLAFALSLEKIQPDHDLANRRDVTRFGVTFDTNTGFSIQSIALA